jgi:hypothetical protein
VDAAVGAHLVGGLKAPDAEAAMSSAGTVLGRHLRAVTDGETGERDQWIGWQVGKLTSIAGIKVAGVKETSAPDNEEYSGFPALAVDASVTELPLRALGYADAAEASYQLFDRLRSEGTLPPELKFQVSVPTAYASVVAWIREEDQRRFFDVYERAIAAEVRDIAAAVPPGDLVIQWDVAVEIGALSDAFAAGGELAEKTFLQRALEMPGSGVERGMHLCAWSWPTAWAAPPTSCTCRRIVTRDATRATTSHCAIWTPAALRSASSTTRATRSARAS